MGNTLAIHWAATTHGTWLHGDPRGSWRNGRLIGADPYLEAETRAQLIGDAIVLDEEEREMVAQSFGETVREHRHRVLAAAVQRTHVHVVFAPLSEDIDTVITRMKRRSAGVVLARRRKLKETSPAGTAGLYSRTILVRRTMPRSLWTIGKCPLFIFDEMHLANAIEYVCEHNRRSGLAADPFDWIKPLYLAGQWEGERCCRSKVCEQTRI